MKLFVLPESRFSSAFRIALLLCLTFVSNANAQLFERLSNPTVVVNLTHPPSSGFKLNKVAFANSTENCADQIIGAITSDLIANNVTVTDRQELNSILQEHHLTASSFSDPSSAIASGKILGPTTYMVVTVHTCYTKPEHLYGTETQYDSRTKTNYNVIAYYSRVTAFLKASIKATDLTTGKVVAFKEFNYAPAKQNKSFQGYPEYPAEPEVAEVAYNLMANDIHQLFLPWSEQKELVYYDDNKGGLKQAFQALKSGDLDQAFNLSQQNITTCKNIPKASDKLMEHAYYNLGMSYMIKGDYDNALVNFREGAKLRSSEILTSAIEECQKARSLTSAMQQIDQKAAYEDSKKQAESDKAAQKDVANTITNADVVKLAKMKLSDGIIIQKIKLSKCNFDTSADALASLTKSGVSEKVVMAMMEKGQ